jgi:hypothetical protein
MIGMNDDTRFLTENRHGQLLVEAETRRLATGDDTDDRTGLGAIAHRLGSHLFGRRRPAVAETSVPAEMGPATRLMVAGRKPSASVGEPCSGSHVHDRAAA